MPPWGEWRKPADVPDVYQAEAQRLAAERTASRHLAEAVREYIRRPNDATSQAMEQALANFDSVVKR